MEAHPPWLFSAICPISTKSPSSGPVDGMFEWTKHLEIVCYLQSPPSKLHLWLHVVNKSLLWSQMFAVALPFPSGAFLATSTECASPPAVRQTDRKQWQESY